MKDSREEVGRVDAATWDKLAWLIQQLIDFYSDSASIAPLLRSAGRDEGIIYKAEELRLQIAATLIKVYSTHLCLRSICADGNSTRGRIPHEDDQARSTV